MHGPLGLGTGIEQFSLGAGFVLCFKAVQHGNSTSAVGPCKHDAS